MVLTGLCLNFENILNLYIMKRSLVLTVLFCTVYFSYSYSQLPTKWRGLENNGHYNEQGLLKSWPGDGPEMLWSLGDLGQGFSSPVPANEKIYLSGMIDSIGYIFEISENGKLLNKYSYGDEFVQYFPGSRSTPVIVGSMIYMLSGTGNLVCIDTNTGKVKWSKNILTGFNAENARYGITENLAVENNVLYCTPGGKENNITALNRYTGELIWSCEGKQEKSAYCSPLLLDYAGKKLLITMTEQNIICMNRETGKMLWSYPHSTQRMVQPNIPLYSDKAIFCQSGYDMGGVKLKLSDDGNSVTRVWFNDSIDSKMGGAVLVNGYLYSSGDKNRKWYSVNWDTGETGFASSEIAKGIVIAADGMLFCYSEKGELALVESNPEKFTIKGITKVTLGTEQHWAHPVIRNGVLYIRHGDTLIAYKVSS